MRRDINSESWITWNIAVWMWLYASAAEFDSMTGFGSTAWLPHRWRWERPRLHRGVLLVTRMVSRWAWRRVEWHHGKVGPS